MSSHHLRFDKSYCSWLIERASGPSGTCAKKVLFWQTVQLSSVTVTKLSNDWYLTVTCLTVLWHGPCGTVDSAVWLCLTVCVAGAGPYWYVNHLPWCLMFQCPLSTHAVPSNFNKAWSYPWVGDTYCWVCTIQQPGFDLPRWMWHAVNHLCTGRGLCAASLHVRLGILRQMWMWDDPDIVTCGEWVSMLWHCWFRLWYSHICAEKGR